MKLRPRRQRQGRLRRGRLTRAFADASLRARVMAAAAILVALTSLVTGFLGTALLRSYLYSRADAQLSHFAVVASRVLERSRGPVRPNGQQQAPPTQFLVEVVSANGQIQRAETPLDDAGSPRLSAAQLSDEGSPFTRRGSRPE